MAITNTSKSKEFIAGSSPIILKGDYRPKIASAPDPMDERNNALENLANQYFNKPLKDLSPKEIELLEEALDEMTMKSAPSMMMAADGGRAQYGLGSLVKSIGKGVKGIVKGAKGILKSDAGKLALLAAGTYFAPGIGIKAQGGFAPFFSNIGSSVGSFLNLTGDKKGMGAFTDALKVGGTGAIITRLLGEMTPQEGESNEDFENRKAQVRDQLNVQFRRLYPQGGNESDEDYDVRIGALVQGADDQTIGVGEMAEGGRVSRALGSDELVEKASRIEGLPINVNSKGVKEVDLRETGGFIPPVGIKEKADDIPAMLSNNEFVFTADAVRAAGGGSVNKGAQRMYDLMKNLESKVV